MFFLYQMQIIQLQNNIAISYEIAKNKITKIWSNLELKHKNIQLCVNIDLVPHCPNCLKGHCTSFLWRVELWRSALILLVWVRKAIDTCIYAHSRWYVSIRKRNTAISVLAWWIVRLYVFKCFPIDSHFIWHRSPDFGNFFFTLYFYGKLFPSFVN